MNITPKKQTKRKTRKSMPREYGIGDFLTWLHSDGGIRRAVRRVAYEDRQLKLFQSMDAKEKQVN
jgi:hypothetical protein